MALQAIFLPVFIAPDVLSYIIVLFQKKIGEYT
jgi:hypothetical protein